MKIIWTILGALFLPAFMMGLFVLTSGKPPAVNICAFFFIWGILYLFTHIMLLVANPRIIDRRQTWHSDCQPWETIIIPAYAILLLSTFLILGLEIRHGWHPSASLPRFLTGLCLSTLGTGLTAWAIIVNPYYDTTARIQYEHNHQVYSRGPYAYLRHPGYSGAILFHVGIPLVFGSRWAWLPTLAIIALFGIRTLLEDRFLRLHLIGYAEYQTKTSSRLVPGLW